LYSAQFKYFTGDDADDDDDDDDVGVSCLHKVISAKVILILRFHVLI